MQFNRKSKTIELLKLFKNIYMIIHIFSQYYRRSMTKYIYIYILSCVGEGKIR